ncbi:MAG: CofH family radical SAM protein [Desulfobacteraceae bacterium]|jgi:cyclic dehypoxanthinyl futalosine synthase
MDEHIVDVDNFSTNNTNPPTQIGERYDRTTAYKMLTQWPMGELMNKAHQARMQRLPGNWVTFVMDTNPNYTNICVTGCRFCAFCKTPGDPKGYTLTPDAVAERVHWAAEKGATTVLLQGGHNPQIGLSDWKAYIEAIQKACPEIHIHPFSPAEVVFMARKEGRTVKDVLKTVYDLGITTIPGGGAEILNDRVRAKVAPAKATAQQWLDTCATAHEIGFKTTATLMYGHVERDEDIIDHLFKLRDLQDHTQGFTSFIAWSFKPGNTKLAAQVPYSVHPAKYVRLIATARLILDNFQHIQSSWFSESLPAGQLGLLAGADDFGGILVEENVLCTTGHDRSTTLFDIKTMISRAGFTPAQRDSNYQIIQNC